MAISQIELARRRTPDWKSVTFCHPSAPEVEMLFSTFRVSAKHIDEIEYGKVKKYPAVRQASIGIWAQHRSPLSIRRKRFWTSWDIFSELIAAIADVGNGIIDSPECESLFTPIEFRRYHRKHNADST